MHELIKVEKRTDMPRRARADPNYYFETVLGVEHLYDKQREMNTAIANNSRVAVLGANGTGKDWDMGRVILWWMGTRRPAKVLVVGPTHDQVSDIVFKEARDGYQGSRMPLGGTFYEISRWSLDNNSFAVGKAVTDSYNLLGYHSPNLLVIITEAHNMPQDQIDNLKRLLPKCVVMTGNPFCAAGEFYDAFNGNTGGWYTIKISAFDTPNLQQGCEVIPGMATVESVAQMAADWGEDSALYVGSVLGEFPDDLENTVVPRSSIMAAVKRKIKIDPEDPVIISCDVARFGNDRTVVYRRRGHRCRKLWDVQGYDTMQVAGKLILLAENEGTCKEHRVDLENYRPQPNCDKCRPELVVEIIVDETGMGAGVVDRLNEEDIRDGNASVSGFNGGEKADNEDRYVNAIAEAWLELARAFKSEMIDIDDNPALISQLSSRRYKIQGDRRLALETKADYKKRSNRSPDDADALAMAYSPLVGAPSLRFFDT